jgi:hypothetical protein
MVSSVDRQRQGQEVPARGARNQASFLDLFNK